MQYQAYTKRYQKMLYRRCGESGLQLPAISLGLWHNFGDVDCMDTMKKMLFTAFDTGITHFDLANVYGPSPGIAEENFGRILHQFFKGYRDQLIISTKAGYSMWPGPYGCGGSKKHLMSSLDQSLKRMGLDYVDIFYSHCYDPNTPLEETMQALSQMVKQGKALYIGISSYNPEQTKQASDILRSLGTPALIHQPNYSMFERSIEDGLQNVLTQEGLGTIAFCPLAQGMLTNKYLKEIPADSRAAKPWGYLKADQLTKAVLGKIKKLHEVAEQRGQTLAQMALAWVLKDEKVTSALIGASRPEQIVENIKSLKNISFTTEELQQIDEILNA